MESLKHHAKRLLIGTGLYHRLRTSSIHDFYRGVADKKWILARDKHLGFYRRLLSELRQGDLIFDVGANDGLETDLFLRLGARVIAIDPDEANLRILRERFVKFRIAPRPVVIVGNAVSDTKTTELMLVDGPGSAVNTLSKKWASALKENKARHSHGHCGLDFVQHKTVETTTLEDLIALYGRPFFIKIDVEGYELNVIRGLRQPVPYLSFEVNLPEFRPEGLECVVLLENLAPNGKFNYSVDCAQGLKLDSWLDSGEFSQTLERCGEGAIEVFWKSSAR